MKFFVEDKPLSATALGWMGHGEMTFAGFTIQKMDAKGRVSVPASLRRHLEGEEPELMLVPSFDPKDPCVCVYPKAVHDEKSRFHVERTRRLIQEAQSDTQRAKASAQLSGFIHAFSRLAEAVKLDGLGRFVVVKRLREILEVEGRAELVFAGSGDHIRIYHPQRWDALNAIHLSASQDYLDSLGGSMDSL